MPAASQQEIPIQPVEKPILCNPFTEPAAHWHYDTKTGVPSKRDWRRPASYWFKTERTGSAQLKLSIEAEEESEDLPLVNALRDDVRQWRKSKYENATQVTKQLLAHWWWTDRARRLFFCQLEAVETVIDLTEILASGKKPRWKPALSVEDFEALCRGQPPTGLKLPERQTVSPTLIDQPNEPDLAPLIRYGCKMATGSDKTVVMSMVIAWAFSHRGRVPGDTRFPAAALVVCPNLTVKERLQVLRPDQTGNYYELFDIVPSQLMPELQKGKVLVTNWHLFAPESPHAESGRSYTVVNKGEESADAFAQRVLSDLYERAPVMVLNDEAHHAYRPAAVGEDERLSADDRAEREEATVWISGLDRINQACGIRFCMDLSARPFYLHGSGYAEGSLFPWLVSDFGLVDAIESGIVKIPRIPVSSSTGRPEPEFFALWKHIQTRLQPGERLPGGKPKPDAVWREAQAALLTLASQWKQRFDQIEAAKPGQEKVPPVLIIVGDNTDIAELFYRNISGEESIEIATSDGNDDEDAPPSARKKAKPKTP